MKNFNKKSSFKHFNTFQANERWSWSAISEDKKVWGPMEFNSDITLLRKLTNWKPKHSLEEGLKKTYNIMKSY